MSLFFSPCEQEESNRMERGKRRMLFRIIGQKKMQDRSTRPNGQTDQESVRHSASQKGTMSRLSRYEKNMIPPAVFSSPPYRLTCMMSAVAAGAVASRMIRSKKTGKGAEKYLHRFLCIYIGIRRPDRSLSIAASITRTTPAPSAPVT